MIIRYCPSNKLKSQVSVVVTHLCPKNNNNNNNKNKTVEGLGFDTLRLYKCTQQNIRVPLHTLCE